MFRYRIYNVLKNYRTYCKMRGRQVFSKYRQIAPPVAMGLVTNVYCSEKLNEPNPVLDVDALEHEFLIRQATTVNVNAATQLLTVTLVAIQDTSERLRESLSKEICLIRQALEWGIENTPPDHWDRLVAVRGALCDLKHNLVRLVSYMEYAEKVATVAAEVSFLSGNIAASDAICERINHFNRACNNQKMLTQDLQQESLELQQQAILNSPQMEDKLKVDVEEKRKLPG